MSVTGLETVEKSVTMSYKKGDSNLENFMLRLIDGFIWVYYDQ